MKKKIYPKLVKSFLLFLPAVLMLTSCQNLADEDIIPGTDSYASRDVSRHGDAVEGRFIVIFQEGAITHPALHIEKNAAPSGISSARLDAERKDAFEKRNEIMFGETAVILKENGIDRDAIQNVYSGKLKGMTVEMTAEKMEALKQDKRVAYVEPDRIIALGMSPLIKTPFIPSGEPGVQTPSYSINKVGGSHNMSGSSKRAWVIDTGIDTDHEDLNVDIAYGANFTADPSFEDGNGHGTHVAGIIGAKDNGIGAIGVAAGVKVVPVKVLDNQGYGTVSSVLNGINYVASIASSRDVVNISLGGAASTAIDDAVKNLTESTGARVVIAAGNEYQDVSNVSPARLDKYKVYTICASDKNNDFAYFSNYGSGVDFAAPGVDIFSTYKDNQYGYMTGTSMAAPHVAGVMLISGGDIEDNGSCVMPGGNNVDIPKPD